MRTILVSSADTEAAVHSALSTDSAHSVDSSYSIRNNDNAITREEGREGEGQDGSSHSCEGVELSVLEAKSLITNHTPSYEVSEKLTFLVHFFV